VYFDSKMKRLVPFLLLTAITASAVEVRYANEAATLLQGARLPALAGVTLGIPADPGGLGRSPAGLAEYSSPELVVHHAVLYSGLGATQDEILLAVPLQGNVGLGVGISRVGADGILAVSEGEDPDFENPRTFSAADWVATLGVGRSWFAGRLLAGGAVRFLYRDLDQVGIGAQTEASAVWKSPDGWRLGARLDRGFGSFASWMETGREEFSPADVMVGAGLERRLPYFYGTGNLGWESPGLVQGEGSATFTDQDVRFTSDPWLALRASRLAGEFRFDFGGVLRAGAEIQAITRLTDFLQDKDEEGLFGESRGMVAFGAGYLWNKRARVDYALVVDPDLGSMHRVALGLVFGSVLPRSEPAEDQVRQAPSVVPAETPLVPAPDSISPAADMDSTSSGSPAPKVAPAASAADSIATTPSVPAPGPTPEVAPASPSRPVVPSTPAPVRKPPSADEDEWDAPEQSL
jgi:hypothetical protein